MRWLNRTLGTVLGLALGCLLGMQVAVAAGPVDINRASEAELAAVEGVGPEIAGNIVREREENGAFSSVDDLKRVPGLNAGTLGLLKSGGQLVVGGRGGGGKGLGVGGPGKNPQDAEVDRILARFKNEPNIQQVQEAALDYARANPSIIDSWRIRARLRGAAPVFRVDADVTPNREAQWTRTRTTDPLDDYVPPPSSTSTPRRDTLGTRATAGVQATWNLNRLIFDEEEPRVNREAVRLAKQMDQVLDDITRRYFERRRLQVELEMNPPTDINDRVRKEIRLQELTADLDGMTGGWFSSHVKKKG